MRGCNLSSGRVTYTTIGQSIKQQNSEGNALLTREIVLRSPAPAAHVGLRYAIQGGGSFTAPLGHAHSKELWRVVFHSLDLPETNLMVRSQSGPSPGQSFLGLFNLLRHEQRVPLVSPLRRANLKRL